MIASSPVRCGWRDDDSTTTGQPTLQRSACKDSGPQRCSRDDLSSEWRRNQEGGWLAGGGGTGRRKSCHSDGILSAVGEVPQAVPRGGRFLDHSSGPSQAQEQFV